MADAAYEAILCVKNEVFVYKIPPRPSNRGYRASEWKLDAPDWTGRLRVVALGKDLFIKLEDKNSGELFAQCPVETYPSVAVEAVMDSSRYFVIRIKDPSGKSAFIGIGFSDRSDSFDLNVALQDHFKCVKQEEEAEKASTELTQGPKLDLGFKAGQTITLNIGNKKDGGGARAKPKSRSANISLPPPPGSGGIKLPPPSAAGGGGAGGVTNPPPGGASVGSGLVSAPTSLPAASPAGGLGAGANLDLLLDLAPSPSQPSAPGGGGGPGLAPTQLPSKPSGSDLWGDFTAPQSSSAPAADNSSGQDWVQF